jgi:hypothetical protein
MANTQDAHKGLCYRMVTAPSRVAQALVAVDRGHRAIPANMNKLRRQHPRRPQGAMLQHLDNSRLCNMGFHAEHTRGAPQTRPLSSKVAHQKRVRRRRTTRRWGSLGRTKNPTIHPASRDRIPGGPPTSPRSADLCHADPALFSPVDSNPCTFDLSPARDVKTCVRRRTTEG